MRHWVTRQADGKPAGFRVTPDDQDLSGGGWVEISHEDWLDAVRNPGVRSFDGDGFITEVSPPARPTAQLIAAALIDSETAAEIARPLEDAILHLVDGETLSQEAIDWARGRRSARTAAKSQG